MSLLSILRLSRIGESIIISKQHARQAQHYAAISPKKKIQVTRVELPVEKDANKLLTYVCGLNIYKDGEDVKLKPDSEYPEWLWSIKTEPPKLEDLDPNTKAYWRYIRRHALQKNNLRQKTRRF